MLKDFFSHIKGTKTVTGLEIHKDESGLVLHACKISLTGEKLKIEQTGTDMKNTIHFTKQFKTSHLVLCLTGKWIVTKKSEASGEINQQAINSLFPNIDSQDFYLQLSNKEDRNYVSIIRRQEVDDLTRQFSLLGYEIIAIMLGPVSGDEIIGSEEVQLDEKLLPAFTSAFQLLLQREVPGVVDDEMEKKRINFFAAVRFKHLMLWSACLLIFLYSVNLLVDNHYSALGQKAQNENKNTVTEVNKFRHQEREIAEKIELIKSGSWTGGLKFAFLIDRILAMMPTGIRLREISVNPVIESLRIGSSSSDSTRTKTIAINGVSSEAGMVNNWIFALKANSWIEDCQIVNYAAKKEDQKADFALILKLTDHEE